MEKYPVDRLVESAERLTLSNPAPTDEIHKGYRRNREQLEAVFGWVLDDFAPIRTAWLSHIEPGGFVRPHKDAGPHYERWQIPIQPAGYMIVDGVELVQEAGVPFRVEHWKTHEVVNNTDRPRIHLVFDRDIQIRGEKTGFELVESTADTP